VCPPKDLSENILRPVKPHLLSYLKQIGVIRAVPANPEPGQVLARGCCFLHGGSSTNMVIFADGWACTNTGCHRNRVFGSNLEGLLRQMCHKLTGQVVGPEEAWAFAKTNPDRMADLFATGNFRQARPRRLTN
jgi:hypothetical protein